MCKEHYRQTKYILEKYNLLCEDIYTSYNKVKIVDNYDWNEESPYSIIYLGTNESFDRFKDAWEENKEKYRDECYDDIMNYFNENYKNDFDFFELGTLDITTQSEYELNI